MKKQGLFSRWLVLPVVVLAMISALALGFTQASFNDIETSNASTATAWTSTNWTQTSQTDFGSGVLRFVDATVSGNVQLTLGPFAFRGKRRRLTAFAPKSYGAAAAGAPTTRAVVRNIKSHAPPRALVCVGIPTATRAVQGRWKENGGKSEKSDEVMV